MISPCYLLLLHESGGSMKQDPRISPNRDQRTSRGLRRYIAAPAPLLDERTVPVGTRSCVRKMSRPTASVEPALPPAGSIDPAPLGCRACASLHPVWGFLLASPVSVHRIHSAVAPGRLASVASGSRRCHRQSSRRCPHCPYWLSPVAMLPPCSLDHISPPSVELFQLGVRVHASSTAIQSLLFPLRGLHPLAWQRSSVRPECSAACRS